MIIQFHDDNGRGLGTTYRSDTGVGVPVRAITVDDTLLNLKTA